MTQRTSDRPNEVRSENENWKRKKTADNRAHSQHFISSIKLGAIRGARNDIHKTPRWSRLGFIIVRIVYWLRWGERARSRTRWIWIRSWHRMDASENRNNERTIFFLLFEQFCFIECAAFDFLFAWYQLTENKRKNFKFIKRGEFAKRIWIFFVILWQLLCCQQYI